MLREFFYFSGIFVDLRIPKQTCLCKHVLNIYLYYYIMEWNIYAFVRLNHILQTQTWKLLELLIFHLTNIKANVTWHWNSVYLDLLICMGKCMSFVCVFWASKSYTKIIYYCFENIFPYKQCPLVTITQQRSYEVTQQGLKRFSYSITL